jgi:hypothetical protein
MATYTYRSTRNLARPVPLVSWKAVFGGLFIAFLTYTILISLGLGIGGLSLTGINVDNGITGLTVGAGIWLVASSLIALFVGGFVAARFTAFIGTRMAAMQALVVAATYFAIMVLELGIGLGYAGKIVGYTAATAGATSVSALNNPVVQNVVEDAMGDLNLRSEPSVVAQGVAARLLRGDTESAKNYLASQAGITPSEADQRLAELKTKFSQAVDIAASAAGKSIAAMGWAMFITLILGSVAAFFGGGLGARINTRKPLADTQVESAVA